MDNNLSLYLNQDQHALHQDGYVSGINATCFLAAPWLEPGWSWVWTANARQVGVYITLAYLLPISLFYTLVNVKITSLNGDIDQESCIACL
ncbi:hypothetical protein QVD17_26143 [Tagetes erecta]|uniref:Uncharacterized protein n=1 Tax=Tagetes erecta TaxID=13708 RepID=A0AAD8K8T5_TARER|nr:hypothetical protein QVD17_26143 [Tagetes erecta]